MKTLFSFLTAIVLVTSLAFAQGLKVGDKAVGFRLKNIDGKEVSLADYNGSKGVIVIFTCNHCPYAKAYEERIVALDKQFRSQGFPVVAINPNEQTVADDSYANMQARAKEKGFTFPYLVDATQEIARAYGATRTPHVYLLQRVGSEFVVRYIGAIDNKWDDAAGANVKHVEDAIRELLAGKPVSTAEVKAIGCTIKWKNS